DGQHLPRALPLPGPGAAERARQSGGPQRRRAGRRAREILDGWYAQRLEDEKRTFADRSHQGRTSTDLANLARFAPPGAGATLFVDIDASVAGEVDELGEVTFSAPEAGSSGDVVDEVARRAWFSGAELLAVRHEDVPGGGDVAATLRYAPPA